MVLVSKEICENVRSIQLTKKKLVRNNSLNYYDHDHRACHHDHRDFGHRLNL